MFPLRRSAFSRHVMSSVRLMGYSSDGGTVKYHCHIRHQVIDREIFWKRHCTEFGDKKTDHLTLPAPQGQAVPARRLPARSASVQSCAAAPLISASTSEFATAARLTPRSVPALGFISVTCSITCSPRLTGLSRGNHIFFVHGFLTYESGVNRSARADRMKITGRYLRRCCSSRSTPFTFSIMLMVSISTSSLPSIVSRK